MTIVSYENPYPTPEPIPYNPNNPELPDPVDAPPPPDLEHLTADEAIARQQAQAAELIAATQEAAPAGEPPMVTAYKATLPTTDCSLGT